MRANAREISSPKVSNENGRSSQRGSFADRRGKSNFLVFISLESSLNPVLAQKNHLLSTLLDPFWLQLVVGKHRKLELITYKLLGITSKLLWALNPAAYVGTPTFSQTN